MGAPVELGVKCRAWSSRIACSQTARQAELGDVPTLRGPADPGVCRSSARLTRASAPLKGRSRRPGADDQQEAEARWRSDSPPKRRETLKMASQRPHGGNVR